MSENHLAQYSVDELQGYFSDFHKDFYGWRPRTASPAQWQSREWLETQINTIHDTMDAMKETYQGRAELRAAGWVVEETDIDLLELSNEMANDDAAYYGA